MLRAGLGANARRTRRQGLAVLGPAVKLLWSQPPGGATLDAYGRTAQVIATLVDANNRPVLDQSSVSYSSGTSAKVTSSSGGLLTAVANGTSVITASSSIGGIAAITGTATVSQVVSSITGVSGTLSGTDADSPTTLTPVGKDANNNTVTGATFSLVSSQPSVASVAGLVVTLQGPGTATLTLTASPGGFAFPISVTVTHATPVTLSVTPSSITGAPADTGAFTDAELSNAIGTDIHSRLTWASSNPSIITVDPPTLTGAPSPASITQGTGPITVTFPCTNPRAIQTLGGLPTGVTAGAPTVVDPTHISFPLTATGSASVGNASVYLIDTAHGNSGTQTLAVASSSNAGAGGFVTTGLVFDSNVDYGTSTTTNGANVASIVEQAGLVSLAQATSGNQPQYASAKIGGHPALHFIAANTTALIAQAIIAAIAAATDVTVFLVFQSNSVSSGASRRIFDVRNIGTGNGLYGFGLTQSAADQLIVNYGSGSGPSTDTMSGLTLTNSTPRAIAFTLNHTFGCVPWWDSTKQAGVGSGFVYAKPDNDPTPANRVPLTMGMDRNATNPWDGWIPRLLIYSGQLSDTAIATNFAAATTAYGTA